jgi:hypothetical protein
LKTGVVISSNSDFKFDVFLEIEQWSEFTFLATGVRPNMDRYIHNLKNLTRAMIVDREHKYFGRVVSVVSATDIRQETSSATAEIIQPDGSVVPIDASFLYCVERSYYDITDLKDTQFKLVLARLFQISGVPGPGIRPERINVHESMARIMFTRHHLIGDSTTATPTSCERASLMLPVYRKLFIPSFFNLISWEKRGLKLSFSFRADVLCRGIFSYNQRDFRFTLRFHALERGGFIPPNLSGPTITCVMCDFMRMMAKHGWLSHQSNSASSFLADVYVYGFSVRESSPWGAESSHRL